MFVMMARQILREGRGPDQPPWENRCNKPELAASPQISSLISAILACFAPLAVSHGGGGVIPAKVPTLQQNGNKPAFKKLI